MSSKVTFPDFLPKGATTLTRMCAYTQPLSTFPPCHLRHGSPLSEINLAVCFFIACLPPL